MQTSRSHRALRTASPIAALGVFTLAVLVPLNATVRPGSPEAEALTDREFWEFFASKSEDGGTFVSENFVSNETSFQEVIPTLQASLTPGGAYLGVGPEQNFTYIANLRPRIAVIFDIRRQNAMQHLMYKALFELSPTRAEFIARLFSRPFDPGTESDVKALFDSVSAAPPSDSAWRDNQEAIVSLLTRTHGFPLPAEDVASIRYLYRVFFDAGPAINYGYRPGTRLTRTTYATFGMLQAATAADGRRMAFLASDEAYQAVRDLQLRNLVIPVVADFAGPTGIRAVSDYLWERSMTVTAFYLSNVEQYLFRESGAADRFFGNVSALPTDSTSTFIRSVPRSGSSLLGSSMGTILFGNQAAGSSAGQIASMSIRDSAGVRVITMVQDSAGRQVVRRWVDSTGVPLFRMWMDSTQRGSGSTGRTIYVRPVQPDIVRADTMLAGRDSAAASRRALSVDSLRRAGASPSYVITRPTMIAGTLTSGLVSIHETLEAHFVGRLRTYQSVVGMTKTSGWK